MTNSNRYIDALVYIILLLTFIFGVSIVLSGVCFLYYVLTSPAVNKLLGY